MTNLKVRLLNYLETFSGERADLGCESRAVKAPDSTWPASSVEFNSPKNMDLFFGFLRVKLFL